MTAMPMSDYDFEDIDFDALESLDEDDDVQVEFSNAAIPDDVMTKLNGE